MRHGPWLFAIAIVAVLAGAIGYWLGVRARAADTIPREEHELAMARLTNWFEEGAAAAAKNLGAAGREPRAKNEKPAQEAAIAPANARPPESWLQRAMSHEKGKAVDPALWAELRALYDRIVSGETDDESEAPRLVMALGRLGTPEAVDLLTEILENRELDFPHKARLLAEALGPHVDDRLYQAARTVLEANIEDGDDSWVHTDGYLEIIARHKSQESTDFILGLLKDEHASSQVRHKVGELVWSMKGFVAPEALIDSTVDPRHPGGYGPIYVGLASWKDNAADAALTRLAFDAGHAEAYGALARFVEPARLDALVAPYSAGDQKQRRAVIQAIYSLHENKDVTPEERAGAALPILMRALADPADPSWSTALYAVEYDDAYHDEIVARLLTEQMTRATDDNAKKQLKQTQRAVEKSLRKRRKL